MTIDLDYQMVVQQIMTLGELTETRNGKVMRSFYPFVFRCDKAPIVGWRKMSHNLGIVEMGAFVNDEDHIDDLDNRIRSWWKPFANRLGYLGGGWYNDVYLCLPELIRGIQATPYGRRHLFSSWNYNSSRLREESGFLTNCHSTVCQFYVSNNGELHYKTYQRSADVMLGLPYNLIQHWALLEYVAHSTGYKVGTMSYMLGDAHIYESHFDAARELMASKAPVNEKELIYTPTGDKFKASDFEIIGECDSPIKTKLIMEI